MRKLLLTLGLVAAVACTAAAQTSITLAWDYDVEIVTVPASGGTPATTVTNYPTEFVLRSADNASAPLAQWGIVATIPALVTNSGVITIVKQYTVTAQPTGNKFFVLTAKNASGESDFSNVALRSGPPRSGRNLTAKPQ